MEANTTYFYRAGVEATGKVVPLEKPVGHTARTYVHLGCTRCGGAGGSDAWLHTGWTCYDCGGSGKGASKWIKVYTAEKIAKLDAAKAKRDAKKAAKAKAESEASAAELAAKITEYKESNAEFVAALEAVAPDSCGNFLKSLVENIETWGGLTEKQEAAARKAIAKHKERVERDSKRGSCPKGRIEITGRVVSVKRVESQFGTTWKMLVEEEATGFKVWGTIPRTLVDLNDTFAANGSRYANWRDRETLPGRRVVFTATVTPSDDDEHFGFFKRPTKGAVFEGPEVA